MFNRILFSMIAAATLLTASPALAAPDDTKVSCSCCSDGSLHETDHELREGQKQKRSSERASEPRTADEDPFVRNQSWGG